MTIAAAGVAGGHMREPGQVCSGGACDVGKVSGVKVQAFARGLVVRGFAADGHIVGLSLARDWILCRRLLQSLQTKIPLHILAWITAQQVSVLADSFRYNLVGALAADRHLDNFWGTQQQGTSSGEGASDTSPGIPDSGTPCEVLQTHCRLGG